MNTIKLDYKKIENIEIEGIDHKDYPDYCDAYISTATYDGREMTEEELEELNQDSCFVHQKVMESIF